MLASGSPNDALIAYHEARARGGAGLIVVEVASVSAKRRDLPRPVMRGRTRRHSNQAGRQFLEQGQRLTPPQPVADDHGSLGVNAMDLE